MQHAKVKAPGHHQHPHCSELGRPQQYCTNTISSVPLSPPIPLTRNTHHSTTPTNPLPQHCIARPPSHIPHSRKPTAQVLPTETGDPREHFRERAVRVARAGEAGEEGRGGREGRGGGVFGAPDDGGDGEEEERGERGVEEG